MKILLIFFVFISCMFVIVLSQTQKKISAKDIRNDRFEHIRKIINDKIEKGEIPSLSIAVAEKGKIVWMESFGWADKEIKIKASPNTLYSIASMSKPITATGVMRLYEQGKINLDENVDMYLNTIKLKYYCSDSIKVTCRHLLGHTAGLPMHFNYYYDDDTTTIPPIEQEIARYGMIINQPSTRFSYANLGYGILGYIISKTSHKDFEEYMKDEIFRPLGMAHTTLNTSPKTKMMLAKRYDSHGNLMPFSFSDTPGAANCSSTASDLIKFGMFHLKDNHDNQEKILSDSTITLMQSKSISGTFYHDDDYGLGWFINDKDYKYKMVYHAGGMDGVESMIKLIPCKDIAVVALVNQTTYNAEFTKQITDSILTELIPDLKDKQDIKQKNEVKETQKTNEIKQSDLLGLWEGNIITSNGKIPIKLIFQEDGDIHVHIKTQFESVNLYTNIYYIEHKMLLNTIFFNNGHLLGWYADNIPGEYSSRCPHTTLLDLEYQSGKLRGEAFALASSKQRMYYAISHYLELEKKK